jgi:multidrug transporter EmrE-like cation transporter
MPFGREAGSAILGILLFNEPVTSARLGFIAVIVEGRIGLKLSSS